MRGAFFDKVVTFVNAAGLPHSYMAYTSLANSMMLDFKCIINPYNVYVHNRHWDGNDALINDAQKRIEKSTRTKKKYNLLTEDSRPRRPTQI